MTTKMSEFVAADVYMRGDDTMYPTEICWQTGNYIPDVCECEFCEHKYECSGYTGDDEDDE